MSMTFGRITEISWSLKVCPRQQQAAICVGQEDLLSQSSGKPIRSRSSEDVKTFLNSLKGQAGVEPWQIKEAKDALVTLYRDFLKIDLRGQGRGVSGFKDALLQGQELKELYGDLFQKLRTELRGRHYSLRTEHAYKFVTYLSFTSPPFTVDLVFVRFL